jgi:hypothetical protein
LRARSRFALQYFFEDYGEIATVALPSVPPCGFARFVSKPVTQPVVFEETPNHRGKFVRIGWIVENHPVNIVRHDFGYSRS